MRYEPCFKLMRLNRLKILVLLVIFLCIVDTLLYTNMFTVFKMIKKHEIKDYLAPLLADYSSNDTCPLMNLFRDEPFHFDLNETTDEKEIASDLQVRSGGEWEPPACQSRHFVAILIPFRNRNDHLKVFIPYMHRFMQQQYVHYRIFVIEQSGANEFNRGKLFNVGYMEANKISPFHCFVLHDVDLLPQNKNNIYACTDCPRHMASHVNSRRYSIPYDTYFGGALSILSSQYNSSNGFSNIFYGWGGEDDDFYNRVQRKVNHRSCRFEASVQSYFALNHSKEKPNNRRYDLLKDGLSRFDNDGLNDVKYKVKLIECLPLYTRILVDI